jgi:hypothetical protein
MRRCREIPTFGDALNGFLDLAIGVLECKHEILILPVGEQLLESGQSIGVFLLHLSNFTLIEWGQV